MVYVAVAPGSCGEFIQGYAWGHSFMVTCPIDLYSYAEGRQRTMEEMRQGEAEKLPEKSEKARARTMKYLGGENGTVNIRLTTEIPVGKGMASSSADISAVCQASAMALGKHLSSEEIGRIAVSIEPSDAVFYRGIVQYDYRKGMLIRRLGECPEAKLLVFDCGGSVDTLAFNSRKDLVALQQANEKEIRRAVDLFSEGIGRRDLQLIGRAATISAFANQKILYKENLAAFWEAGQKTGGHGVVAAHSGTVLGLLISPDADDVEIRERMAEELGDSVSYIRCVRVTSEGMRLYEKAEGK